MPPQKSNIQKEIDETIQPKSLDEKIADEKKPNTSYPFLKTLRTFQGDMEEIIHKKNESKISIAVAEQKASIAEKVAPKKIIPQFAEQKKQEMQRNAFLTHSVLPLVIGLVLVLGSGGLIAGVYYYTRSTNAPVIVKTVSTLVPYTTHVDVEIPKGNSAQNIVSHFTEQIKRSNQNLGSVLYIHFLEQSLDQTVMPAEFTGPDFFSYIAPSAENSLVRSMGNAYMTGVYSSNTNIPFMIFSSNDYGQTYDGMLAWEVSMANNLNPIFGNLPQTNIGSSSPVFQDETINNKDMRILRNENGQTVLVYGFFDSKTLAITANETIFQRLNTLYINSKLVH